MTENNTLRIQWAPKVKRSLIRQVYQADALGLVDEGCVLALGFGLHQRCRSILMVTDARVVDCPAQRWSRQVPLKCSGCGWQATYGQWRDSWRHQDLVGGNAVRIYRDFYETYPRAQAVRDRLVLIDTLIHVFHWTARRNPTWRPVASQLIEGKPEEVLAFLDQLSGDSPTEALRQSQLQWQAKLEKVSQELPFMGELVRKSGIGQS